MELGVLDDNTSRSEGSGHPGKAIRGSVRGRVSTKYFDNLRNDSASGTIALYTTSIFEYVPYGADHDKDSPA